MPPARWRIALPVVVLALVVLAFWPGLKGGFLFDDYPNIVFQERVHATALDAASMRKALSSYQNESFGRPLATLSFAVDHAIAGLDPFQYKLTSLLVHLVNTLLVWLLAAALLARDATRPWGRASAALLALAWAAHPLQVSTVLYVVQRMEMLCTTFILLGLLAYLHGRTRQIAGRTGWPWLLLSGVSAGLGLLSKESAVMFPFFTLCLELAVFGFRRADGRRSMPLAIAYGAGVGVAVLAFTLFVVPRFGSDAAYALRSFDATERLLTQARVLPMYVGWSLAPLPAAMDFYYDAFPVSRGWLSPATTLLGGLAILGMLALAFACRRKAPLATLGILWFFAAHLLTSNVIPLELVFEHRNYFSLFGILLAFADLARRVLPANLRTLTVGVAIIALLAATLLRSAFWGNPLTLALDLVARSPTSARAATDLGEQYMHLSGYDAGNRAYALAMAEFDRASRLASASPLPEQGMILLAMTAGQPVLDSWWDSIDRKLRDRPISPQEVAAVTGLLQKHVQGGRKLDAKRLASSYELLLSRKGDFPPEFYAGLADLALFDLHDDTMAMRAMRGLVDRSLKDPAYIGQVATTLAADGHAEASGRMLEYAESRGMKIIIPAEATAPRMP